MADGADGDISMTVLYLLSNTVCACCIVLWKLCILHNRLAQGPHKRWGRFASRETDRESDFPSTILAVESRHSKTSFEKNCFSAWASTLNMGLINKVDMVCLSPVGYGV